MTKTTKIIQGISDSNEKIIPNIPADDGTIMKKPETNPHNPTDFLNLGLFKSAYEKSNKQIVLKT